MAKPTGANIGFAFFIRKPGSLRAQAIRLDQIDVQNPLTIFYHRRLGGNEP